MNSRMQFLGVVLALVVIAVVLMYAIDALRNSPIAAILNMTAPTTTTPAPIPLDKGAIIGALRKESKLIVAEQDYAIPFKLSNEARLRMMDTAKNDKSILDYVSDTKKTIDDVFIGDYIEMVGKGRVVLAVDLKSMTTEDVVQNGDVITITTPPVRVYDVIVDQKASIQTERDSGLWLKLMDNDDLRNQAQAEIRPVIMNEACKTTLMEDGQTAAREAIANLLKLVVPSTMTLVVEVDAGSCALP